MNKLNVFVFGIILLFSTNNVKAEEQSPFECKLKTVVQYTPNQDREVSDEIQRGHMGFVIRQLSSGLMDFGGPFMGESKRPIGGMAIYNLTDKNEVEEMTKTDPIIKSGVAKYSIQSWTQCQMRN